MAHVIFAHPQLPQEKSFNGIRFPLTVSPPAHQQSLTSDKDAVLLYLQENRAYILSLLKKHSVLFFRGFASSASSPEDFASYISTGLNLKPFPYTLGNAVRRSVVGDIVFTANEAPPERLIPFHHELAQTPLHPSFISFFCDVPASTGGETPICFSPAIYDALQKQHPEFLELVEEHGVVYSRSMTKRDRKESAIGRGWASTFGATTKHDAETALKAKGYTWHWRVENEKDNDAREEHLILTEVSPVLPAVIKVDDTSGRKAFFNQVFAAWFGWRDEYNKPGEGVKAGNGQMLDARAMDGLKRILEDHEVAIPWRRGDFMVIDNMQAMHSRKTFTGKRAILTSLSK